MQGQSDMQELKMKGVPTEDIESALEDVFGNSVAVDIQDLGLDTDDVTTEPRFGAPTPTTPAHTHRWKPARMHARGSGRASWLDRLHSKSVLRGFHELRLRKGGCQPSQLAMAPFGIGLSTSDSCDKMLV